MARTVPTQTKSTLDLTRSTVVKDVLECQSNFRASFDRFFWQLAWRCFQVEMAHKVLSSDMAELINAMKMAQKYSTTTLDQEYRRGMLSAAHVLAVDAKHLFDVVDAARKQSSKMSSTV